MKEILERAKQLILKPKETWMIIKAEGETIQTLIINYAAPLALIPQVATLFVLTIVGLQINSHIVRAPFMEAMAGVVLSYVFSLFGILLGSRVITSLAPYFNAKSDFLASTKIIIYALTPLWLLGIFTAIPGLAVLQIFAVYSIYLMYLGLPILLDVPREKSAWFTVLIVVAGIIINLLINILVGGSVFGPMYMRMMAM